MSQRRAKHWESESGKKSWMKRWATRNKERGGGQIKKKKKKAAAWDSVGVCRQILKPTQVCYLIIYLHVINHSSLCWWLGFLLNRWTIKPGVNRTRCSRAENVIGSKIAHTPMLAPERVMLSFCQKLQIWSPGSATVWTWTYFCGLTCETVKLHECLSLTGN